MSALPTRGLSTRLLLPLLAFASASHASEVADWPRWRGPQDAGSAPAARLPVRWEASRVVWKTTLPGKGTSTPIIRNDRVLLTAPVDGRDALLAYDLAGALKWSAVLGAEDKGKHRNASGSNPSPVTDGRSIFALFKSGALAATDLEGRIRWQVNLVEKFGPIKLFWDYGTSPVLTERHVIVARMHQGESWLAAFDKEKGELVWKTPRNYDVPREVDNGYTTPLVVHHEGREALLTWGAQHLTLHEAANGNLVWSCGDFNPGNNSLWPAIASPVVASGVAVVCFGRADRGQPRLHGVKLGGKGDVTRTHRLWTREDVGAFVPTPAGYKDRLYVLSDRGQIDCVDPVSGKSLWSEALPRSSSNYYASPLVADGIMYAAREDGAVFVVRVEGGFKLLMETKVDDRVVASIVPAGDKLLIRGDTHLYCVAGQ